MIPTRMLPRGIRRRARLMVDLRPASPLRGDLSQNGEFSYLSWLVPDDWPKTLVEVGANDGLTFSNSRNLLLAGWRGVLVEPHPRTFEHLKANTADTDVHLFNFAASESDGQAELFEDTSSDQLNLMATLVTVDNSWYQKTRSTSSVGVTLRRLDSMLSEAGVPLDFTLLSTDTEGHDTSVLKSLGNFRPRLILTERALSVSADALEKQTVLTRLGYIYCDRVGCNEVYVHHDWLQSLPHIQT
jgi:FkbM family methyltransferase